MYSTVWYYQTWDEDHKPYHRRVFFRAASIEYYGKWMGPNESVWMIPYGGYDVP